MRGAWLCALCLGLAVPAVRAFPNPLDLVQDAVGTEEREVAPGIYQLHKNGLVVEVRGVSAETWDEIEDLLRDQISLSGAAAPSAPLADDLAYFTRQSLLQSGYPDATATWQLQPPGVVLWVREDQREWVGQIQWAGEPVLPTEELESYLLRPTREREERSLKGRPFVLKDLEEGVELVRRRLRGEGRLDAKVTMVPAAVPDALGNRDLTVTIEPGPAFLFGRITVEGLPDFLKAEAAVKMADRRGQPFNEAEVQQLEGRLASLTSSHGYLDTATTSEYDVGTEGGTVDVAIRVQPGNRYTLVGLKLHPGFTPGAERVLRAQFDELVGGYYSTKELNFVYGRTIGTGLFGRLEYEPVPVEQQPDGVAHSLLYITGEQLRPHTVGFEIGYDSHLGPQAGVSYRNPNLFDSGNAFASELGWSGAGPIGSIEVRNPALFGSPNAATIRVSAEQFERYDYERLSYDATFELSRRVSDPFRYSVFLGAEMHDLRSDVLTPEELGPDQATLAFAGVSLLYDKRDSSVLPSKGWYFSARAQQFFDIADEIPSFNETELRGAAFFPLADKLRFSLGASLHAITGASASELPIDARVFNGGPNSVRSFEERELGPRSARGSTPLGGTSAFVGSAELSYEIVKNLEFAVFGDVGSLNTGESDAPYDVSTDLRTAVGAGLRYRLPFGPIRVDYGYNLDRREEEEQGVLHITVGFSF